MINIVLIFKHLCVWPQVLNAMKVLIAMKVMNKDLVTFKDKTIKIALILSNACYLNQQIA